MLDVLKSLGIIVGGAGSLAALFVGIGTGIVIARLREYNLFGVIHYTEEYVSDAGMQFLQDLFTFFQDWRLIILFSFLALLVSLSLPLGPAGSGPEEKEPDGGAVKLICAARKKLLKFKVNYAVFFSLLLIAVVLLTSKIPVRMLYSNVSRQQDVLMRLDSEIRANARAFSFAADAKKSKDVFTERFIELLSFTIEPTKDSIELMLLDIDGEEASSEKSLSAGLGGFQEKHGIKETPDVIERREFGDSLTYKKLVDAYLTSKIVRRLSRDVSETLDDFRSRLGSQLTDDMDFDTLVRYTVNYPVVNRRIEALVSLRNNIQTAFVAGNDGTKKLMSGLGRLRTINFGYVMLSYSFWILLGSVAYLVVNFGKLFVMKNWERAYYISVLLMLMIIMVTLTSSYGRYKYEFKIQKVVDMAVSEKYNKTATLNEFIADIKESGGRTLYVLGPTKGKEVFLASLGRFGNTAGGALQIVTLEKDVLVFMAVEPVDPLEVPGIIEMLRNGQ